jgi:hypothetical protein
MVREMAMRVAAAYGARESHALACKYSLNSRQSPVYNVSAPHVHGDRRGEVSQRGTMPRIQDQQKTLSK